MVRDISESLVEKLVNVIQDLEDALEDAKGLIQSNVAEHFIVFRQIMARFALINTSLGFKVKSHPC